MYLCQNPEKVAALLLTVVADVSLLSRQPDECVGVRWGEGSGRVDLGGGIHPDTVPGADGTHGFFHSTTAGVDNKYLYHMYHRSKGN